MKGSYRLGVWNSYVSTAAAAAAAVKSLQSCLTLCNPIDGSPPGSPVPGILQTRTLEWVAISFQCMKVKSESEVAQSCPTLSAAIFKRDNQQFMWMYEGNQTNIVKQSSTN